MAGCRLTQEESGTSEEMIEKSLKRLTSFHRTQHHLSDRLRGTGIRKCLAWCHLRSRLGPHSEPSVSMSSSPSTACLIAGMVFWMA